MRAEELISKELIVLNLELNKKEDVIRYLTNVIYENDKLLPDMKEEFIKAVLDRETQFSTAVGYSFGIPHGKSKAVKESCIIYASLKEEIEWSEDEKVKYIFMIGVPEEKSGNEHLEILIKLSTSILEDDFREELEKANDTEKVLKIIYDYTEEKK